MGIAVAAKVGIVNEGRGKASWKWGEGGAIVEGGRG